MHSNISISSILPSQWTYFYLKRIYFTSMTRKTSTSVVDTVKNLATQAVVKQERRNNNEYFTTVRKLQPKLKMTAYFYM